MDEKKLQLSYAKTKKTIAKTKLEETKKLNDPTKDPLLSARKDLEIKNRRITDAKQKLAEARTYNHRLPNYRTPDTTIESLGIRLNNARRDYTAEQAHVTLLESVMAINVQQNSNPICYNADFKYIFEKICDNLASNALKKFTKNFENYLDGANSGIIEILKNEQKRENEKTKALYKIIAEVLAPLAYILDSPSGDFATALPLAKDYAQKKIIHLSLSKFSEIDTQIDKWHMRYDRYRQSIIEQFRLRVRSPTDTSDLAEYTNNIDDTIKNVISEFSKTKSNNMKIITIIISIDKIIQLKRVEGFLDNLKSNQCGKPSPGAKYTQKQKKIIRECIELCRVNPDFYKCKICKSINGCLFNFDHSQEYAAEQPTAGRIFSEAASTAGVHPAVAVPANIYLFGNACAVNGSCPPPTRIGGGRYKTKNKKQKAKNKKQKSKKQKTKNKKQKTK